MGPRQGQGQSSIENSVGNKIEFADAVAVFADEMAITMEDERPEEDRFVTIGMDPLGRILVVVFTWRGDDIRIISARKATPNERRQYEG
jgi:uncharacterized DUF497 family protein